MRISLSRSIVAGALAIVVAMAAQDALAQPGSTLRNIRVDVSPLRANAGEPTASWVQHDLSVQLAQALAGRIGAKGGPIPVQIDYLTLSSGAAAHCGSSQDTISGIATIGGVQTPVRATTSYQPAADDHTMIEHINHDRVSRLVQALAFWLSKDL
jgi:hypothetical protein